MSFSKKLGKLILITLCITTVLFIYKSGFEDDKCDLSNTEISDIRHLLTKAQKDVFCTAIAITNLAGADVANAVSFLTNQTDTAFNSTAGSYLGLSDDPASVVNFNIKI
jgi:hypothetical protein